MKNVLILPLLLIIGQLCIAQDDPYIISQQKQLRILPVFQSWEDEGVVISELSVPLSVYYPVSRKMSLMLTGNQASISSDNTTNLSGLTDSQLLMSYHLDSYQILINGGINLPSGKADLNPEEFETSKLISLNHYNFRTPSLGQGLMVNIGATWAYPFSEGLIFGAGFSYQYKGEYAPVSGLDAGYKPGNELLLTAGLDMRLSSSSVLSFDGILTSYQADQYDGKDIYQAGNKIVFHGQFRHYFSYHELLVYTKYRMRSTNSLPVAGSLADAEEKSVPDNLELSGQLRFQIRSGMKLGLLANYRSYQKSSLFNAISIVGGGLVPQIRITDKLSSVSRLGYFIGSIAGADTFSGFELGTGLAVSL